MSNLPTLAELHLAPEEAFKNDQLNLLLSQSPPSSWIKNHPGVKVKNEKGQFVPSKYLPIDKVEFLLTRIFQKVRTEILREGVMFHSVYVIVRLHYVDPVTKEWTFQDGCGAVKVQCDEGANPSDLSKIKAGAIQMALPSAEAYAKKDAAENIGRLFGRDLNRKDLVEFVGAYSQTTPVPSQQSEDNYQL